MLNVLIADDSKFSRNVLIRNLPAEHEYSITQVSTGEQAVEAYADGSFDLVLMDLTMPGIGGLEATRMILEGDRTARIAVVTADVQEESRRRAEELGILRFIPKPAPTDVLRSTIDSIR